MIEIPVHNPDGKQVGALQVDEQLLGGEVRPALLKQAYVRYHANRRQGSSHTRNRSRVSGSTRKLYRQKGTGNARRGAIRTNIMRGGGVAFSKQPKSWRMDMPRKMRRLANRNALLAKMVDEEGQPMASPEIKIVDSLQLDKPSTSRFSKILDALKIDRKCLLAIEDTRGNEALSARNLADITITQIDRLNAYDLLSHRYLLVDQSSFQAYLNRAKTWAHGRVREVDDVKEAD